MVVALYATRTPLVVVNLGNVSKRVSIFGNGFFGATSRNVDKRFHVSKVSRADEGYMSW
jgi:hypothetical protein